MRTTRTLPLWIVLLALLGALGCQAGQDRGRHTGDGSTYTVRAKVVQLPAPENPASGLYLSHEAIDRFVDRDGKIVGMEPMTMPFPLAEDVSLEGIRPGDVVEFKLHVDWGGDPEVEITGLRKLPPDTQLSFRSAEPQRAH
jgi:hypothetical protein